MVSSIFRLAPFTSPPEPLPLGRVPGPKLAPFTPNAWADIEFDEFLGQENDADSQVWKVQINGAGLFALKAVHDDTWHTSSALASSTRTLTRSALFSFTSATRILSVTVKVGDLTKPLANLQLYVDYFDPFNCECRAYYDQLKEEKREHLAVKAYGYLLLTPQQETDLA